MVLEVSQLLHRAISKHLCDTAKGHTRGRCILAQVAVAYHGCRGEYDDLSNRQYGQSLGEIFGLLHFGNEAGVQTESDQGMSM